MPSELNDRREHGVQRVGLHLCAFPGPAPDWLKWACLANYGFTKRGGWVHKK